MGRKSTGCIRYRGDYQFRASITIDGKEKSETFSTRESAEQWIDGLVKAKHEGQGKAADEVQLRRTTLGEALRRYVDEVTPDKKSVDEETRNIEAFLEREQALCAKKLYDVGTADLKALIKRRMKPVDPDVRPITGSTMNRQLAFISHLFTIARVEWDYEGLINPVVKGLRRKENASRERRLEDGEEEKLLHAARVYVQECSPEIPIVEVIKFALGTAMRLSEIGRCHWKNVNLAEATILIPDTKNGSPRTVPLWPSIVRLLSSMPRRADGLVFGPKDSIRQMWNRVLARTDIDDLRYHDLRHEATSRLFESSDLSDMEIAAITGHKSLVMLKRYAHLRANKLAKKLARCEVSQPLALVVSGGA